MLSCVPKSLLVNIILSKLSHLSRSNPKCLAKALAVTSGLDKVGVAPNHYVKHRKENKK